MVGETSIGERVGRFLYKRSDAVSWLVVPCRPITCRWTRNIPHDARRSTEPRGWRLRSSVYRSGWGGLRSPSCDQPRLPNWRELALLAATVNCTFVTGENCAVMLGWSSARIHHGGEATWMERCNGTSGARGLLLKHYLDQGLTKAELSRRFGVSRRTIHYWIDSGQLDRDLATGQTRYSPRRRSRASWIPTRDHRSAAAGVAEAVGAAIVRRG